MRPVRRVRIGSALLAVALLIGARGALAQATAEDFDSALDPEKRVSTLEDWDKILDVLNQLAWRANEAGPKAALQEAAAPLADQKTRAWLAMRYVSTLSSLIYHELVLEPWLARGAESDRAFANEQAHAMQQALTRLLEEALRSSTPRETWSEKFRQARNAFWDALNAERKRLVKEQAALPNPIPVQPHIRDKSCPQRTEALPAPEEKVRLELSHFPSAESYYPPFAKRAGMDGAVRVSVLVSETGCAQRAEVMGTSGAAELDDGALALALDGVYLPRAQEGVLVPGEVTFAVTFQLKD